jgi:hypothetical protein
VLLYTHTRLAFIVGIPLLYAAVYKLIVMSNPALIIKIIILLFTEIVEAVRLYNGYYGNLRESVI